MTYNIYYNGHFVVNNLFDLTNDKLDKIIIAYKIGEESFTLTGKKYPFHDIREFRIFTNERGWDVEKIKAFLNENKFYKKSYDSLYINPEILAKLGQEITDERIGDLAYGCEKKSNISENLLEVYVDLNRIEELKKISSIEFDLNKLIRLCEELNSNWSNQNFFTVGLLVRTIINHIPPIFGQFTTFDQVQAGYGSHSLKKNMKALNESLRSVADIFTHDLIRKKDPLPNAGQVDFRSNLDILFVEIVKILNK